MPTATVDAPRTALVLTESLASVAIEESLETILASAPPDVQERVGRQLQEAAAAGVPSGLYPLHVIRPGIGRGKGRHLYEADMLAKNADVFRGWRMYIDHLSESARKALGGLPRSIRDLGGRITEAWWDPNVPEDRERGYGQGAVVGLSRPVPYVADLIEHDPDIIEASISARATGVTPKRVNGEQVWVVEGIEPKGSVDWVTEAGAGGKIVSLIEAHYDDEVDDMALLESLGDDDLMEIIKAERPELAARLAEASNNDPDGDGDDDTAELNALIAKLMKKGMNREMATKVAQRQLASAGKETQEGLEDEEGDDEVEITVDALREALTSDEGQTLLDELFEGRVEDGVQKKLDEVLPEKIEEALSEERELLVIEANAEANRRLQLRDFRDTAHRMIREAKLPDAFAKESLSRFDLNESGQPTADLDVLDDLDGDGNVVKAAEDILTEAVETEIKRQRELLAAARPTRVSQPKPQKVTPRKDADGNDIEEAEDKTTGSSRTDALLVEAGFSPDNLDKVYG